MRVKSITIVLIADKDDLEAIKGDTTLIFNDGLWISDKPIYPRIAMMMKEIWNIVKSRVLLNE